MLRGGNVRELVSLRRQGLSITAISELTGYSRHTVRKYLLDPRRPVYGPRKPRGSKLDPHKEYLAGRLQAGVWNAVVLLRELRSRGYAGGYSILKAYLSPLREAARESATRRFETAPGEQAQVDWGDLGEIETPAGTRRLSVFLMTLGHSRAMFAQISTSQKLEELLRLHEEAFRFLGGVPREILYDQMRTVVLGFDERGEAQFHGIFMDFARHWGFVPRLCRPYRPQTKGKVESGVGYVRRSFVCGQEASSLDDLGGQLRRWIVEVANRRVHGTTHRVVEEALEEERPHLQPLVGRAPYPYLPQETRRVARDAYIEFRTNRYSVPFEAVGRQVTLRERGDRLEIHLDGSLLAEHALLSGRYQIATKEGHHRGMPFRSTGPGGRRKARIHLRVGAPEVEIRSLDVYERLAEGVGR